MNRRHWLALGGALAAGGCAVPTRPPVIPIPATASGLQVPPPAVPLAEAQPLLAELEKRSFDYFWDTADPASGLVPDRWPTPSFASIAAVGFGLSAYCIGAARGFVTRAAAAERTRVTLRFLHDAPQGPQASGVAGHRGFFYHFLDMRSGHRFRRTELSTVDTALLLAGALHARAFFDGGSATEAEVRRLAEALYARVDWRWAQNHAPAISHGWLAESGFLKYDWLAYNEAMLVYLLAMGSPEPRHAVGASAWRAWASNYPEAWGSAYGHEHLRYASLFTHQFTHAWVDLRGVQDAFMRERGIDYFENSRRATLAQRTFAVANPDGWAGYGAEMWGITACDGPADVTRPFGGRPRRFISYGGRGMGLYDDGTVAPYGAGSSMPFAPDICASALVSMQRRYGHHIWGRYGFYAFNPSFTFADVALAHGRVVPDLGWVDGDYLGIEVGPLLLMLANHRDDAVWRPLRGADWLQRGLRQAGFAGGWLA